jgi:SsrA-binding protein
LARKKEQAYIARNKRARYDFEIADTYEAGLALVGSEVKSLRRGRGSLAQSYATVRDGEVFVVNVDIPPYEEAGPANHDPKRTRKCLLRKREIRELAIAVAEKGLALVPLELYWSRNVAKVRLGLGRGRKAYDKREAVKKREAKRDVERALHGRSRRDRE